MALWEADMIPILTNSDWGFMGNIMPIILIISISWFLSKKVREVLYIQLPLTLGFKIIFPFLHTSIVITSLALAIMNVIGSREDLLADVKAIPQNIRDTVMERKDILKQAKKNVEKEMKLEAYEDVKSKLRKLVK